MAVFRIKSSDVLIRFGWYDALNSIQSFDWSPTFNEQYFQELGNDGYAAISIEPELSGSLEFTGTGSTVAFLRRMIAAYDGSGEFTGFLAGSPTSATHNVGTIDSNQLEYAIFDLIEAKKANEEFQHSTVIPRAALSTIAFTADAAGVATETYTFEGEPVHVFPQPWHDVISIPLTRDFVSPDTTLVVPDVPGTSNPYAIEVTGGANMDDADWVLAYIYIDDVEIEGTGANVVADWTGGAFDGTLTLLGNTAPLGSRITAIIYRKVPGQMPTLNTPPSNARFVRANSIDLFLVKKSVIDLWAQPDLNAAPVTAALTDERQFLRVQSMDMTIDLRREALRQLKKAKSSIFYRAATYPLNITGSLSLLEHDLSDWAMLQEKVRNGTETPEALELDKLLNILDFEDQEWQLVVRYYKDDTVIQTMALCDARISGYTSRVAVEGNVEITWNMTGSLWKVSGAIAS